MKKLLCLITILLILLSCVGCGAPVNMDTEKSGLSFVLVEQEIFTGHYYKIVYHKETKVMYVLGQYNDFTVMLNPDGSPMVWEGN